MAMRFRQKVEPWPRGRIRYRADVRFGCEPARVGYRVSEHFAVSHGEYGPWTITHLPTGRIMPGAAPTTLAEAKRIARKLERLASWGRYTARRLPGQGIARRLEKAFGWTLRGVA